MALAIEKRWNGQGYLGTEDTFSVYVPDVPGYNYIFFTIISGGNTDITITWDGDDITALADYQETLDLNLMATAKDGYTGYFRVPDGDKGTTKNFVLDWDASNPNTIYHAVFISGVDSIVDVNVNDQQTTSNSGVVTDSTALADGEMLLGSYTGYHASGIQVSTVDYGAQLNYDYWTAFDHCSGFYMDIASEGAKTGQIGVTFDQTSAEDSWSNVWKVVPSASAGYKPFILEAGSFNAGSASVTLNPLVDLLVVIYADGRSGTSDKPTAISYNSVSLTKQIEAGYANNSSVDSNASIWTLPNPGTGASYTLSLTGAGGSTYEKISWVGIIYGNKGVTLVADSDKVEANAGAITVPAMTTTENDLVLTSFGHWGNTNITPGTNNQFLNEDWAYGDDAIGALLDPSNGNYFSFARGEDGTITDDNGYVTEATLDKCWAGIVISGADAGTVVVIPIGTLPLTGLAPSIAKTVHKTIPTATLVLSGNVPSIVSKIVPKLGQLILTGHIPLVGDEVLNIRNADGTTLHGTVGAGDACILVSDGVGWKVYKLLAED